MTKLQSMTGFASASSTTGKWHIVCEMRSVNGKTLDIRLRVPSGLEPLEPEVKKQLSQKINRGNVQVSIVVENQTREQELLIDEAMFGAIAIQAKRLASANDLPPPTTDGILAIRGVVASPEAASTSLQLDKELRSAVLDCVSQTANSLASMREVEGASLQSILATHLHAIAEHTIAARDDDASQPIAIRQRIKKQISELLNDLGDNGLDEDRLNAEAAVLVTKADIREEIDRLHAHVAAASDLLTAGGVVGRKLDFLAQEFNREANTICSKSSSATLTATGLALKAVIDQFREQVQNLQ